ncbi:type II toxin-antitoxin system RelE/ParE family toxin [Rugamonas apoptosis]|uniref:Type II toxin-antitoxin system RelE/ParE family toxin n=1 Tax=Rugamonas apoptosis TaxID=2758570 RepID=A0A7W2FAD1_9BURK|nr:type II toxin-antitoxin system RelE/ParE family toxin [Rugamonas apoptosis]MBA5688060.1 type II toxin-antitoxin system RelE/ParE family toxin [Rugamonas apoptosis]
MKLVIVPAALAELRDAAAWYAAQANADLARAFVEEVERVANLVSASRQLGAVFRGNQRRYFLRKFPYCVIYQIVQDQLRVLAIAHQRRRPAYWSRRK